MCLDESEKDLCLPIVLISRILSKFAFQLSNSYVEIWTEAKHNPRHAYLKPTTSIALLCNNLVYELIYVLSFSSFKKYKHRVVPVYPNMDI